MNRQPRHAAAVCREDKLPEQLPAEVTMLPEVIADLPVGLYAEQISHAGQQQRKFRQALTHPALISAAFNLDRALGA